MGAFASPMSFFVSQECPQPVKVEPNAFKLFETEVPDVTALCNAFKVSPTVLLLPITRLMCLQVRYTSALASKMLAAPAPGSRTPYGAHPNGGAFYLLPRRRLLTLSQVSKAMATALPLLPTLLKTATVNLPVTLATLKRRHRTAGHHIADLFCSFLYLYAFTMLHEPEKLDRATDEREGLTRSRVLLLLFSATLLLLVLSAGRLRPYIHTLHASLQPLMTLRQRAPSLQGPLTPPETIASMDDSYSHQRTSSIHYNVASTPRLGHSADDRPVKLILVTPPANLPHDPPSVTAAQARAFGSPDRFKEGILIPLQLTLNAQLAVIAREYALPSIVGLSLHVTIQEDGQVFKPKITTDEAWSACWSEAWEGQPAGHGSFLKPRLRALYPPTSLRYIEKDLQPSSASWSLTSTRGRRDGTLPINEKGRCDWPTSCIKPSPTRASSRPLLRLSLLSAPQSDNVVFFWKIAQPLLLPSLLGSHDDRRALGVLLDRSRSITAPFHRCKRFSHHSSALSLELHHRMSEVYRRRWMRTKHGTLLGHQRPTLRRDSPLLRSLIASPLLRRPKRYSTLLRRFITRNMCRRLDRP